MTIHILLLLALHVVASSVIAKWKWSKLQEYLSLHRLLDVFPIMIAVENKRMDCGMDFNRAYTEGHLGP